MSTINVGHAELDFSKLTWRKSQYSAGHDNCVEVGEVGGVVAVRDSKRPGEVPLVYGRAGVRALLDAVRAGAFDRP